MPVMALLRWAFLCTQWTAMGSCCSEEAFLVNVSGDIYVRALAANWPLFKRFHFIVLCRREFCHSPHIQAYIELTVNGNRRLGRSLGVTWHLWLTREEKVIEEHFSIHSVTIWVLAVFGYTRDSRVQRAACVFERTREGSWGISQSGGPATQSFLLPMENYLKYHFEEWLMVACSLLLLGC